MKYNKIELSTLESECALTNCDQCAENGCSVRLDRMPDRSIFRPDEAEDNEPRADCSIFFPEEDDSSNLYRNSGQDTEPKTDYLAVVELKNTISRPKDIKEQIEGAIDFSIDLLKECGEPPWGIQCFCLIAKNKVNLQHKSVKKIRIRKNISGDMHIFRPLLIDSDESLREAMEKEDVANSMSTL